MEEIKQATSINEESKNSKGQSNNSNANQQLSSQQQKQQVLTEEQYKKQVRQDIGMNLQGKPKMPVIFYQWNDQHETSAKQIIQTDSISLAQDTNTKFEQEANKQWDKFYKHHKLGFFKHRHYLKREFPELVSVNADSNKNKEFAFCELGCGVGDTIFPLQQQYPGIKKFVGLDFSEKAIEWVKKSPEFDPKIVIALVFDLAKDEFPKDLIKPDLATLIFCLSAIAPQYYQSVANKIFNYLKPGAILYFRDYGRYDFAQLKFSKKKGRKLQDNFYLKQDGTRVYYFDEKELQSYFEKAGFQTIECHAHYRYLENRKTGQEMYRVWIQGRFKKPGADIFENFGPCSLDDQVQDDDDEQDNNQMEDQEDKNKPQKK